MPIHAENDNEGYWRIGGTLYHWHAEFTRGRDYREESANDTVLWWLVRQSAIIISWKYNCELQRQILEAQKHQFLRVKHAAEFLKKKNQNAPVTIRRSKVKKNSGEGTVAAPKTPLERWTPPPHTPGTCGARCSIPHYFFLHPSLHFIEICLPASWTADRRTHTAADN